MAEYPTKLGEVPIPDLRYQQQENRAHKSREILNGLVPGRASLYEFQDNKEARDYRSMLYSMAILKFGESGRIATKVNDNLMYIWLVDPSQ